jgi:oxygen-independent coproporphyrinogen-3 oxidase
MAPHCPRELSVEANPDSLAPDVLDALADAGATRVSVGVQSTSAAELQALGRVHGPAQALDALSRVAAAGLDVSCDLMCATPLQTEDSWEKSLADVLSCGVGHVSVYPLQIEDGTALGRRYADEDPAFNAEDVQAARMEAAERALGAAGLARYEVASYARPGKACAHNQAYWTGVPYLGIGTGASGMLGAGRLRAPAHCGAAPTQGAGGRVARAPHGHERSARIRGGRGHGRALVRPRVPDGAAGCGRGPDAGDAPFRGRGRRPSRPCARRARRAGGGFCRGRGAPRGACEARADGGLAPTRRGWLLGNELYGIMWGLAPGTVREVGISCAPAPHE